MCLGGEEMREHCLSKGWIFRGQSLSDVCLIASEKLARGRRLARGTALGSAALHIHGVKASQEELCLVGDGKSSSQGCSQLLSESSVCTGLVAVLPSSPHFLLSQQPMSAEAACPFYFLLGGFFAPYKISELPPAHPPSNLML